MPPRIAPRPFSLTRPSTLPPCPLTSLRPALRYIVIRERMPNFSGWSHSRHARRDPWLPEARTAETGRDRGAPRHREIAELAYFYWEARGRHHGSDAEDWLRAERELTARRERRDAAISKPGTDAQLRSEP